MFILSEKYVCGQFQFRKKKYFCCQIQPLLTNLQSLSIELNRDGEGQAFEDLSTGNDVNHNQCFILIEFGY